MSDHVMRLMSLCHCNKRLCEGRTFVCQKCKQETPWCCGAHDDAPGFCDDCRLVAARVTDRISTGDRVVLEGGMLGGEVRTVRADRAVVRLESGEVITVDVETLTLAPKPRKLRLWDITHVSGVRCGVFEALTPAGALVGMWTVAGHGRQLWTTGEEAIGYRDAKVRALVGEWADWSVVPVEAVTVRGRRPATRTDMTRAYCAGPDGLYLDEWEMPAAIEGLPFTPEAGYDLLGPNLTTALRQVARNRKGA